MKAVSGRYERQIHKCNSSPIRSSTIQLLAIVITSNSLGMALNMGITVKCQWTNLQTKPRYYSELFKIQISCLSPNATLICCYLFFVTGRGGERRCSRRKIPHSHREETSNKRYLVPTGKGGHGLQIRAKPGVPLLQRLSSGATLPKGNATLVVFSSLRSLYFTEGSRIHSLSLVVCGSPTATNDQ